MKEPWLDRPAAARLVRTGFALLLAASLAAQLFVVVEPHVAAEGWFGAPAVFGFVACAAMVAFAKLLGAVLKRPDDHYGDDGD